MRPSFLLAMNHAQKEGARHWGHRQRADWQESSWRGFWGSQQQGAGGGLWEGCGRGCVEEGAGGDTRGYGKGVREECGGAGGRVQEGI